MAKIKNWRRTEIVTETAPSIKMFEQWSHEIKPFKIMISSETERGNTGYFVKFEKKMSGRYYGFFSHKAAYDFAIEFMKENPEDPQFIDYR